MDNQLAAVEKAQEALIALGIEFGPRLLVAILFLIAGFYAGRWAAAGFDRWLTRLNLEIPVRLLLVRVARIAILGLFAVMALQNLGVDLLPLIAGLSVAGAGIALAMQGVLGNLAAGLTIIFTRPFRVGEYIAIAGVEGKVEAVDLFATRLSHTDASTVVIPNRKIVGEILHNYGLIRQLDVSVPLIRAEDVGRALAVIREAVAANARLLKDPAPVIGVATLGDASIHIAVRPWSSVADFGPAGAELSQAVVEGLRTVGIVYPPLEHRVRLVGERDAR
jgi:small conductance mechanosensitive channel